MDIKCAYCRKCTNAAYQAFPVFAAGNRYGEILIIGQNPGEMHDNNRTYSAELIQGFLDQSKEVEISKETEQLFKLWYEWDFGTSFGCTKLSNIFGEKWLESRTFCYTNAVRCRTKKNASPSQEMISNCKSFTKHLIYGRKLVVFVGKVAASQWFTQEQIDDGKKYGKAIYIHDASIGNCLIIPHYASIMREADFISLRDTFLLAQKGAFS